MTRINGDDLSFIIDGVERKFDATSISIEHEEASSGTITFWDQQQGSKDDAFLRFSTTQDLDPASLYGFAYRNPGVLVPFLLKTNGNTNPTTEYPHISGVAKIGRRPNLGGEAAIDADDYTADHEWKVRGPLVFNEGIVAPAILAVSPVGAAAGQVVQIVGSRFTGATAVKFGTTSAEFVVHNEQSLAAIIPAGKTGSQNITIVHPDGTSAAFSYSAA